MGVSRITAYIIATRDDIVCTQGGPAENGKFVGWITLGEDDRYRPLLNTEPIYDTPEEAVAAMKKEVADIKESVTKELDGKDPIEHIFDQIPKS